MDTYTGYLAAYISLIREHHERGVSTRGIAEALYEVGARAQTSGCDRAEMSRVAHIVNLQGMVIYVQRRLGLRIRRVRILNLKANGNSKSRPSQIQEAAQKLISVIEETVGLDGVDHIFVARSRVGAVMADSSAWIIEQWRDVP